MHVLICCVCWLWGYVCVYLCNMRVGGGNCHFVLASISCIAVRCVVFEHVFYGTYQNINHTNFLKLVWFVHRWSIMCPKIGWSILGWYIPLLSSLFKTFGIVFVARDTRALVYSFPMYHLGFGVSHHVGLMWRWWRARVVFDGLCGGRGLLLYGDLACLVWQKNWLCHYLSCLCGLEPFWWWCHL